MITPRDEKLQVVRNAINGFTVRDRDRRRLFLNRKGPWRHRPVTMADVLGPSRLAGISDARAWAMAVLRAHYPDMSTPRIARFFNCTNHTTVLYAIVRALSGDPRGPKRGWLEAIARFDRDGRLVPGPHYATLIWSGSGPLATPIRRAFEGVLHDPAGDSLSLTAL